MSKRLADKYITDRNWDEEEEPEEAGVFKQADKSTLERRPIKRAARRVTTGQSPASGVGNTFKGFAGFTGFKKTTDTVGAFGSLSSNASLFTNGSTSSNEPQKSSVSATVTVSESSKENDSASTTAEETQPKQKSLSATNSNHDDKQHAKTESKYLHQLKSLNESVAKWIKQHVDRNPYCILTPIFRDYESYLSDLEKKYPPHGGDTTEEGDESSRDTSVEEKKDTQSNPPQTSSSSFSFGSSGLSSKTSETSGFKITFSATPPSSTSAAPLFSPDVKPFGSGFGSTENKPASVTTVTTSSSGGLFGSTTSSSTSSLPTFTGFKFGATGSVFGQAVNSGETSEAGEGSSTTEAGNADEEEYVPPKVEVKEIKEEGAVYSKRCKLFFQKNDEWKEKGLGHLHLKPCGEKTQLLVRADTTLGNILLNIMLVSTMPLMRQGKNNVTLVCVPNPPIDGMDEKEMVPMLIRVKTAEDADELFEKLKELKS